MNRNILGAIALLMIAFKVSSAQPADQIGRKPIHCQGLNEPPQIGKLINGVISSEIDSLALKREIDSTYQSMSGRWLIVQIQGGWGSPKLPTQPIELTIDNKGQTIIREANKTIGAFNIQLIRNWGGYQSPLNPEGQSLFSQHVHRLDIELCGDTLVLNEGRGDGMEYVFKRSISK